MLIKPASLKRKSSRTLLLAYLHFLHARELYYSLFPRAHWVGY